MAYSLEEIQEGILEHLNEALPQPVYEQAVPDIQTLRRTPAGDIDPYVAIQFGDIQNGRGKSMAGPIGHDYILPIYIQVVGPTPRIARRISNRAVFAILGESFPWSGSVTKRSGGNMWPIVNSNNATEAYLFPASFGVLVQLSDAA